MTKKEYKASQREEIRKYDFPSSQFAPYSDAVKLILTGSAITTTSSMSTDKQSIYKKMMVHGLKDKNGKKYKERYLPGVRIQKWSLDGNDSGKSETWYDIFDLYLYMEHLFKEWNIKNPPVDYKYINNIHEELLKIQLYQMETLLMKI